MKKIILAALVAATAAPAIAATDGFGGQRIVENGDFVELNNIRTESGGRVEILDGIGRDDAVVLGGTDLRAGLSGEVRVQLAHKPFRSNVLAVLYNADGEVTATRELRVLD